MRYKTTTITFAVTLAFAGGVIVSPLLPHVLPGAQAAAAPAVPQVIDLMALTPADMAPTANPLIRGLTFISTPNGSVGVQSGSARKHTHQQSDEIQYIVEGSGSMWVGNELKQFKPGTLIIIPHGTPHAGGVIANGPVKAIAIKLPPQQANDTQLLD